MDECYTPNINMELSFNKVQPNTTSVWMGFIFLMQWENRMCNEKEFQRLV